MIHYKQGLSRNQELLFPMNLDKYISKDNIVRAIDSYVDILDIAKLGFKTKYSDNLRGQPAFSPALMLKLYLYGYLHKIRSSRNLAREANRNIELIWLLQELKPNYKTIANFRKNNVEALKEAFKEFVLLCKDFDLIGTKLFAVDGTFLKANVSRKHLLLKSTIEKRLRRVKQEIEEYLRTLDSKDKEDKTETKRIVIINKVEELRKRKQKLDENLKSLEKLKKTQYNSIDPDAALMVKPGQRLMAYNSQIVVDSKHKLIVATDVSSNGNDSQELYKMAKETKEHLALNHLTIVADKGYDSTREINECIENNIYPIVPRINKQQTQQNRNKYTRDCFIYNEEQDYYSCVNNKRLIKAKTPKNRNKHLYFVYRASNKDCRDCPLRENCILENTRFKEIHRSEHEEVMQRHYQRMKQEEEKAIMKQRGSIVEHPFGTIKRILGWDHYLVRGKKKVIGENALIMLGYNFKRVWNILGSSLFRKLLVMKRNNSSIEDIKRVVAKELILYIEYFVICMKYTFFYRRKYHFLQFVIRKNFLKLNLY